MSICEACGNDIGGGTYCLKCGHKSEREAPVPQPGPSTVERTRAFMGWETGPKIMTAIIGILIVLCLLGNVVNGDSKPSAETVASSAPRVYVPRASYAPATYEVTYSVGGSTTAASLTYENEGGNAEQKAQVGVPWATTFRVESGAFLYVSAQNKNESGSITCEIKLDGAVIEQASSDGAYTIATCSGSAP